MTVRLIPSATLPVSRWPNGAGRKADIAAGDGWLIGFAWLDADAPFSDLAGWDRTITLVEGPGFTLDLPGGAALAVPRPFEPARFDGGAAPFCRVRGPCRVLNAMTARAHLRHRLGLIGRGATAGCGTVVMLRGAGHVAGLPLRPLDAVALDRAATLEGDADTLAAAVWVGR